MIKKSLFILLFNAACVMQAGAQEHTTLLTLEEAMSRALANNPQMEASNYEVEAAERERKAAIGLYMPQINVAGGYTFLSDDVTLDLNGLKEPIAGAVGGIGGSLGLSPEVLNQVGRVLQNVDMPVMTLQERNFGSVGAHVVIPVFTGGKITAANHAAKIKVGEAEQQHLRSQNSLVSELTERYYGLSLALQVIEVRRQVLDGMRSHLSDAQKMEAEGVIARGDRLYAEVHTSEAERDCLKVQRDAEVLRNALGNTLNTDVAITPVSNMFVLREIEEVAYFKEMANRHSPLLKQVELKHDLALEGVRLQQADFWPQLSLMGAASFYNYQVSRMVPRWAVGAGVKIRIFNGLHSEFKYSAARSQARRVEALGRKADNDVMTMIDKLYSEMQAHREQLTALEASRTFALEYLRIKEEGFKAGVSSSSDVVDARLNLAKIRVERLQTAYYYDLMLARLLEVCGLSEQLPLYGKRTTAIQVRYD